MQLFVKIRIRLLKKGVIVSDRMFYDSIIDKAADLAEVNRPTALETFADPGDDAHDHAAIEIDGGRGGVECEVVADAGPVVGRGVLRSGG